MGETAGYFTVQWRAGMKRMTPLGQASGPEVRNLAANDANYL